MSQIPTHHHDQTHPAAGDGQHRPWTVLAVTLAAQVLVVLDISVVNTALPSIGSSLGLAGEDLQWLVTAYVMLSGGGLLLGGRVNDLLSRRGVFLTGLALFTLASVASGLADTGAQLVAARAAQGLSAAVLTPSALSLITTTYAGHQQKAALALWGAVGSLGVAAGVLVGGALTTWTSWQFIFWVNAPVGLVAFVAGSRVLERDLVDRPRLRDFDLPGAGTVIAGLSTLVYVLAGTATHGWWSVRTAVGLGLAVVLLGTFLAVERRAERPLFPPHVWRLRALVSGTAVMLGVTGILVGAVFLGSIFMQTVLGYSAVRTGVAFLPFALAITIGTVAARHLLAHLSPRAVAASGLVLVAGAALLLSHAPPDAGYAVDLLPGLIGLGVGVGMVFVPVSVSSMAGIPHSHAGVASGFLMTGHEIGAALGVAVLSAVASTAGSLVTQAGAADAFARGFVAAAAMAAGFAVVAVLWMPAARMEAAAGMRLH
ncbi:MFS transporter [Nocardioides donggukensis]|uniref:MFS transporter n=1 Tax=Nocardioides donggukensis TaxID=2774019 RepID=A0A927K631_9ACTN|nr:MFS transporter [Nocardioides donggukensis]MBD8870606.1 MFS transporter [Nocardioides donggukensis]